MKPNVYWVEGAGGNSGVIVGTNGVIVVDGKTSAAGATELLADIAKIAISLTLIAPLAFCMGMPFPLALSRIAAHRPDLVPWAWGINGCASVLSAILATLLAMSFGFRAVVLIALALYLLAAATFRMSSAAAAGC